MRVVPGLRQTPAYVEAIIRNDRPFATEAERTRDLEGRVERQEILHRAKPPNLWALLAEGHAGLGISSRPAQANRARSLAAARIDDWPGPGQITPICAQIAWGVAISPRGACNPS